MCKYTPKKLDQIAYKIQKVIKMRLNIMSILINNDKDSTVSKSNLTKKKLKRKIGSRRKK